MNWIWWVIDYCFISSSSAHILSFIGFWWGTGIYVKPLFAWFSSVPWKGYRLYWWVSHTELVLFFSRNAQTTLLYCTRTTCTISHVSSCVVFIIVFFNGFLWAVLLDLIDYLDINYFFLSVWIFIFSANAFFAVTLIRKHTVGLPYFKFMNIFLREPGCVLF